MSFPTFLIIIYIIFLLGFLRDIITKRNIRILELYIDFKRNELISLLIKSKIKEDSQWNYIYFSIIDQFNPYTINDRYYNFTFMKGRSYIKKKQKEYEQISEIIIEHIKKTSEEYDALNKKL